jgi:hypothetical protein
MAKPPRKSRRISSKRSRALHIEDKQEVHIPAQSNTCRTAQSEGSDIKEKIQEGIQATIYVVVLPSPTTFKKILVYCTHVHNNLLYVNV